MLCIFQRKSFQRLLTTEYRRYEDKKENDHGVIQVALQHLPCLWETRIVHDGMIDFMQVPMAQERSEEIGLALKIGDETIGHVHVGS